MRLVIQRVDHATVNIDKRENRKIGKGLLVLLGIEESEGEEDIDWLVKKIVSLRIFDDEEGVMNLSVSDVQGDILLVSQFTLHASTKKGNRPSYIKAARPERAIPLYNLFIERLRNNFNGNVQTGEFGAHMDITFCNNGPVTIIIDSKNKE